VRLQPTQQTRGVRGDRSHRRRLVVAVSAGAAVLGSLGLLLLVVTTTRHVRVVRVVTGAANEVAPRRSVPAISGGAPAPLAPDPRSVGAAAAAAAATSNATSTTPATDSVLAPDASASFVRLSATLPGRVELAVAPLGTGSAQVLGEDTPAHGWSTAKVPVLVALLRARGTQGLTARENLWARAAITESDNQSILDLFGELEHTAGGLSGASTYVQELLRSSGDTETVVATASPPPGAVTTFGQTEWRPSEAVKFFRALGRGCLLPADENSRVLNLMESITPSESWGLGSAGFGSVAFKGGWGPEASGGYLVRQSGIIDAGSSRGVAVSIVAFPSGNGSASFSSGTQMLTATAVWLRHELRLVARGTAGCSAG
jgi:hypothetical protein